MKDEIRRIDWSLTAFPPTVGHAPGTSMTNSPLSVDLPTSAGACALHLALIQSNTPCRWKTHQARRRVGSDCRDTVLSLGATRPAWEKGSVLSPGGAKHAREMQGLPGRAEC